MASSWPWGTQIADEDLHHEIYREVGVFNGKIVPKGFGFVTTYFPPKFQVLEKTEFDKKSEFFPGFRSV